ncbi:hypothetical protein [Allorhizobium borbori]|uniref:Uncharacterized protein n=1 Tax=Allorhizobium borbori TaxID=485907 RepID=A0A7W6K0Z5_9HYPH|nr:hypothetical protein [Allorhizobium borbori]MBB4103168.1 hypothetical protein [Allorhizobium borbori]
MAVGISGVLTLSLMSVLGLHTPEGFPTLSTHVGEITRSGAIKTARGMEFTIAQSTREMREIFGRASERNKEFHRKNADKYRRLRESMDRQREKSRKNSHRDNCCSAVSR